MPGKPIRAAGQTATTISLSEGLLERIDRLADKEGRKRSPWIVRQLERLTGGLIVDIPSELVERIDAMASGAGLSRETWIRSAIEKTLSSARVNAFTPRAENGPHVTCPPEMPGQRIERTPARAVSSTSRFGGTTHGLNEEPAEERKIEVKPEDRLKGRPKPKSTRGIRKISRPGGRAGEK